MTEGEMGAIHQKIYALCKGSDRDRALFATPEIGRSDRTLAGWESCYSVRRSNPAARQGQPNSLRRLTNVTVSFHIY